MSTQLNYRAVTLNRASLNASDQTIEASLSSEAAVERYPGEMEILSHDPDAVDLSRAVDGLPLLFGHDHTQPIGVAENVTLKDKKLVARLRFGSSQRAKEIWSDVQAGIMKNLSIGYRVHDVEAIAGGYLVKKWSLFEASMVSVPMDATIGVGRSANFNQSGAVMETNILTPDATRARIDNQIRDMAQAMGAPSYGQPASPGWGELADGLIRSGATVDEARTAIFRRKAEESNVNPTRSASTRIENLGDPSDVTEVSAMTEALSARFGVAPSSERAREYTGLRVTDFARRCLEIRGVRTTGMNPATLISRAQHSTSDFPLLLAGTGERILRQGYLAYQGGIKRTAKASTARDFRAKTIATLGEMPELKKVNQAGEFTYGSTAESSESYRIDTYGRIFGISRQALVNDDLGAFADMAMRYGRAAAEFEAKFLVNLITSNPVMASDGVVLFHANHGNLSATGAVISVTTLGAARQAMRLQKGLDGKTPIDASPRYLVVPAALETVAEQIVGQLVPSQVSNVNPFSGKLEVVVDPRLDANSATAWYLSADPMVIDTIEYSYLETEQGPVVEAREGFEVDGVEVKVRLDFGAGVLDHRGFWKNPGA